MKKNLKNNANNLNVFQNISKEQVDQLVKASKEKEDSKRNLYRLKMIMSRTYISKLIH